MSGGISSSTQLRYAPAYLLQIDMAGSVLGQRGPASSSASYTVYGALENLALAGSLRFNAEWLHSHAEGYMLGNGHRLYRPMLMRFTSPDRLSPFGEGGLNAYAYSNGDPVNRHDPSGREWSWIIPRWRVASGAAASPRALTTFPLTDLPNEMVSKVVESMDGPSLASFSRSSKRMNSIVKSTYNPSISKLEGMLNAEQSNADQLVVLAKVSQGLTDIPKDLPAKLGYPPERIDKLIAKVNRAPYLPVIERFELQREAIRQEGLADLALVQLLAANGHALI